ncbi:hypothetical protein M758_5G088100 [Ceratodon purpureus]|nr:hypothetical protein M758_5G088100 [Ceratodon purpureus]
MAKASKPRLVRKLAAEVLPSTGFFPNLLKEIGLAKYHIQSLMFHLYTLMFTHIVQQKMTTLIFRSETCPRATDLSTSLPQKNTAFPMPGVRGQWPGGRRRPRGRVADVLAREHRQPSCSSK